MINALAESWIGRFSQTESLPLLAAVVAVTTMMLILTRRRTRKNGSPETGRGASKSGIRNRSAVNDEVDDLLLQLQAVAREITGQIDTRARMLEAVIRDADRKIARLEKLSGQPTAKERSSGRLDVTIGDDSETQTAATDTSSTSKVDASHESIYAMADEGASPVAIARKTGRPTGEVELILSLRPVRGASPAAR